MVRDGANGQTARWIPAGTTSTASTAAVAAGRQRGLGRAAPRCSLRGPSFGDPAPVARVVAGLPVTVRTSTVSSSRSSSASAVVASQRKEHHS
jgi:hypothetical protein